MPRPPHYFPVYAWHPRLPEPGLHANPLTQSPPVLHFEGLHTIRWLMSDPEQLTRTVKGDGQVFALRDHDSGSWIPHLPLAPLLGPFLLDTHLSSKYQLIFHQPNVQMDGSPPGVFQWGLAPPWRCVELALPIPKFLAKGARAAAFGKRKKDLQQLADAEQKASTALQRAEQAQQLKEAVERLDVQERLVEADEQIRQARAEAAAARERKTERDRLARRGLQNAERHEAEARTQLGRAASAVGRERANALEAAARQRAEAESARSGAAAWAEEAARHERDANAYGKQLQAARQERKVQQKRAERRARDEPKDARQQGKQIEPENPHADATGVGNTGVALPSLLAHVPFPATVQLRLSWEQLGKTWLRAWANFAVDLLRSYVGFLFDGVLAPGKSKRVAWLLDLAKSVVNDGLIGGSQKYLLDDELSFKVSKKLGPLKVGVQLEEDSRTGKRTWKASAESKNALGAAAKVEAKGALPGAPEQASLKLGGQTAYAWQETKPPVVYGQDVPLVN